MDATLAIRPIRTTLTNGEGRVTNSLKCAEKEPPVSTAVIVAAVIAAIPTLGIGALLVWGIRHYYLACKAEERQREQAEFACGVIFEKIQSSDNGDRSITISLSTGYKVVCTQKGGNGLWISTNGGKETTHPDLLTIEDLKNFFINDIKENIDFYVEKNPKNSLIALFSGAINNENNKDELDDLIRLIERVDRSADHNLLEKFQEMFSKLETYIEKICSGFKDKLRVKIVPGNEREDGFTFNVTFNDFCIASPLFRAEKPLRDANESFITLLTNARANGTEAALINSIEAMDAFARANKFNEFQKSICSLKSWIERNDTDFKGKLRVEVTEIRGKSTFAVKLGDLCIAKPAFYNNRLDGDLFQFEADVYDEDGVKLHTILSPQSVEGLLSEVTSSPDSLLFEVNSSRLSHFLKKMDENSEGLKLKVETKQEHSTVTLILPGNDERHQVNFEGNLKLNDRLFSKVNEEDVASQLFQANDIEENNWLKWVIQEKANPNQLNNCNKLWNKNKTFNGGIEEKANPKKLLSDSELKEQKKKNIDEKFAALFKDQNRSRTHLPTSTENNKGIFAKDENNVITLKDGEGFLTQENYSDFIQHCFSNIVEYNNLLEDEKEFYEKFKALGIHNKKHFVFNIYSNTTEQDAIDKLEDQFTLADRGLLSEDEQVRLNSLQAEFLLLAPEKQERLKDTFFGVDAESLLFYGMDKQYQDKIKSLSMQEQALYLLFVDQHYKTPIAASKVLFTGMGMLAVDDKDTESFYSFKPLPVNPYFPRVVNIEVKYNVRFSPFGDYSPVRDICASDEATGIYTVLFDEDETLLGAKISLDDVKSNLKVHGKDGTLLQQGLRKISAAEIELMQEDNVVII